MANNQQSLLTTLIVLGAFVFVAYYAVQGFENSQYTEVNYEYEGIVSQGNNSQFMEIGEANALIMSGDGLGSLFSYNGIDTFEDNIESLTLPVNKSTDYQVTFEMGFTFDDNSTGDDMGATLALVNSSTENIFKIDIEYDEAENEFILQLLGDEGSLLAVDATDLKGFEVEMDVHEDAQYYDIAFRSIDTDDRKQKVLEFVGLNVDMLGNYSGSYGYPEFYHNYHINGGEETTMTINKLELAYIE